MSKKKPVFTATRARKRPLRKRQTPRTAGRLVDLYLGCLEAQSVIDNYLSSYSSLTKKEKADLSFQQQKRELLLIDAKNLYHKLDLEPWENLPKETAHAYKIAASGAQLDAVALTCNLGHSAVGKAESHRDGRANYVGSRVRELLKKHGLPDHFAMALEFAPERANNPTLHFHASLSVPEHLQKLLLKDLKHALAHDYEEKGNKAVLFKGIYAPGGWEAYVMKQLAKTDGLIGRSLFATHESTRLGKELYKAIRQWLKTEVRAFSGAISPHLLAPKPTSVDKNNIVVSLVVRKMEQIRITAEREENAGAEKKTLVKDSNTFRADSISHCSSSSQPEGNPAETALSGAEDPKRLDPISSQIVGRSALVERYSGRDDVGLWGSSPDDEAA